MADYQMMPSSGGTAVKDKDPFYVVKDRMQGTISQLSLDFDQWKDALNNSNTHKNPKFKTLTQAVKNGLKGVVPDLGDLNDTVQIVEKNREKFKDITDTELSNRRKFIADTKNLIQEMQATVTSKKTKAKIEKDQNEALIRSERQAEHHRDTQDFIENKKMQQQQLEEKQDVVLDDMYGALQRLGAMGEDIKKEIAVSNEELQGLDRDVEDAQTAMNIALKKLQKLLGTSDTGKLCCIFILFITAVALFLVIVSG
jgi:chromosome segregation ATPase